MFRHSVVSCQPLSIGMVRFNSPRATDWKGEKGDSDHVTVDSDALNSITPPVHEVAAERLITRKLKSAACAQRQARCSMQGRGVVHIVGHRRFGTRGTGDWRKRLSRMHSGPGSKSVSLRASSEEGSKPVCGNTRNYTQGQSDRIYGARVGESRLLELSIRCDMH